MRSAMIRGLAVQRSCARKPRIAQRPRPKNPSRRLGRGRIGRHRRVYDVFPNHTPTKIALNEYPFRAVAFAADSTSAAVLAGLPDAVNAWIGYVGAFTEFSTNT
jgi:hypothetical protein